MGYDQTTLNKVGLLQYKATVAQGDYNVAYAVAQALALRVSAFELQLQDAKTTLDIARSNFSSAKDAEGSVQGTMKAALSSARQALVIYAYVKRVFELSYTAAQQAVLAAYNVSDVLDRVTTAEAKNSYITRQLLTAAQSADTSAAAVVSAATNALQSSAVAFVAAKQAVWSAFLVMAGVMNLQRMVMGYANPPDSNALEIPDALMTIPQPDMHGIGLHGHNARAKLEAAIDKAMADWIQKFTGNSASPALDAVASELEQLVPSSPPHEPPVKGLLHWMKNLRAQASKQETFIDDATTQAKINLAKAQQQLANKAAARDAANKALLAAQQAA